MSKREKALEKFRNNPRNVRYEELEALLMYLGFEKRQENTNHLVFSIQGHLPITVPRKRPFLKQEYVKNDIQAIDELDLMDDDLRLTMNNRSVDEYLALPYTIEVIRDTDLENPGWVARVLELPGCITQADTLDELCEMIEDAMRGWIEVALEDGLPIPEPRPVESFSGKFVVRVPKSLHRELVEAAEGEGVSLNMYITTTLGRAVGQAVNVSAKESTVVKKDDISPAINWSRLSVQARRLMVSHGFEIEVQKIDENYFASWVDDHLENARTALEMSEYKQALQYVHALRKGLEQLCDQSPLVRTYCRAIALLEEQVVIAGILEQPQIKKRILAKARRRTFSFPAEVSESSPDNDNLDFYLDNLSSSPKLSSQHLVEGQEE